MYSLVLDLLKTKGNHVCCVKPEISVYEVLMTMAVQKIGSVIVVDNNKNLMGIFTERDYARKLILKDRSSRETSVEEMMTKKVLVVDPKHTLEKCMAMMTQERVRYLPVIENSKIIGIISIGDVLKKIINEQKFELDELQNYIMGYGY